MSRWNAYRQLVLARMREFFREPMTIFWVYGFPLILALILGAAFNSAKPEAPAVDVAGDVDPSRATELADTLKEGGLAVEIHPEAKCQDRMKRTKISLFVVPRNDGVEYVFDPTRADAVQARYWVDAVLVRAAVGEAAPEAANREITEKGSRYIDFLLPGLVGINLMGGGLFGLGFVLVDMRVRKLFKRLMATPLHRGDFLGAMLSARLLFLIPEMFSLLVIARLMFGVPVTGSWGTLIVVVLLGSLAFSGLGLMLASRTDKIETISGLINAFMLPMYLLSGVFFSSRRFPEFFQPLIQALPLTQLNDALREVMLEGLGLAQIWGRLAVLAVWAVVCFALALRWFKWT